MNKAGIFCDSCPLRSGRFLRTSDKPVGLSGTVEPVSQTTARHHLGINQAVRLETVNSEVEAIEEGGIIVPADMAPTEAENYFVNCDGPAPNMLTIGSKRFQVSLQLGRSCAALAAIEQQAHS